MKRSVCLQIALISICLVYLILNGTTIIQTFYQKKEETVIETSKDYATFSKSDQEAVENTSKTKDTGHIYEYLEKISQYSENLMSKDCQEWDKIETPSHKYILPINTQKTESAKITNDEEDDEHRIKSFEKIFDTNAWGQSKSGPGSLIPVTGRIRNVLKSVIEETKKYLKKRFNKVQSEMSPYINFI